MIGDFSSYVPMIKHLVALDCSYVLSKLCSVLGGNIVLSVDVRFCGFVGSLLQDDLGSRPHCVDL